jgi:hypothetical protein
VDGAGGDVMTTDGAGAMSWTTPAGASAKEVFFAATDYANDEGDYRTRSVGATAIFNFSFMVPADFTTLVTLEMVFIPESDLVLAPLGPEFELTSDYASVGQDAQTHDESNTIVVGTFTANEMSDQDISSVYSVLAAGDVCGLMWNNNGVTNGLDFLGIRLVYTV